MNEHSWFIARIESAVAKGLLDDERERFDAHAQACETCASLLADAQADDRRLLELFADHAPPDDLEQRVIDRLNESSRPRRRIHPAVRRAAIAAAAILVLGTTGYIYDRSQYSERYAVVSMNENARKANPIIAEDFSRINQAIVTYRNDAGVIPAQPYNPNEIGSTGNGGNWYNENFDYQGQPASGTDGLQPGQRSHRTDGAGFVVSAGPDGNISTGGDSAYPFEDSRAKDQARKDLYAARTDAAKQIADAQAAEISALRQSNDALSRKAHELNDALTEKVAETESVERQVRYSQEQVKDVTNQIEAAQDATKTQQDAEEKKNANEQQLAQDDQVKIQRAEQEAANKDKAVTARVQKLDLPNPQTISGGTITLNGGNFTGGTTITSGAVTELENDKLSLAGGLIWDDNRQFKSPIRDMRDPPAGNVIIAGTGALPNYFANSGKGASPSFSLDSVLLPSNTDSSGIADSRVSRLPVGQVNGVSFYAGYHIIDDGGTSGKASGDSFDATLQHAALASVSAEKTTPAANSGQGQPGQPQPAPETPPPAPTQPVSQEVLAARKIIRTGSMEFQVDSFDSATMRLEKIVEEENGFIGATDSNRLGNGKVQGSIVVRVPPENLDVLVLKLRGLGDLMSQKITAADVTKQFTDMDSELRAARAMETRLLAIIKDGTGEVKDLLEAEKELAIWREKIEAVEGEMRYINSQVALSTLTITLSERDIKAAAAAFESEQVTLSLESEKVDESYVKAKDAILDAKGRIVESELKQISRDNSGAKIIADVAPEQAEALIGRLRQFPGRVATFNRERKQTTDAGTTVSPGIKVEQHDTRFEITLYNVATIAPRHATSVVLATPDVEQSTQQITSAVSDAGGRMLGSTTTRPNVGQISSLLKFDIPSDKAPAVLLALHAAGEISKLETTDNADTANSTTVKEGFAVQILSFAMVFPRDVCTRELATNDVASSYQAILNAAHTAKARIIASSLDQQDQSNITGYLDFEIARQDQTAIEAAITLAGETIANNVQRSADGENVINDKVQYKITIVNAERLAPRETTTLSLDATDVEAEMNNIIADAIAVHGRSMESTVSKEKDGAEAARVIVDVPLDQQKSMLDLLSKIGVKRAIESSRNPLVPDGKLARARFDVTLATPQGLVDNADGPWKQIREGLSTGLNGLLAAMKYVIIGMFFAGPVLILWGLWKLARRKRAVAKPAV